MSRVATMIREARERAGLTQARLAELLGVQQSHVSRWETGAVQPRAAMLERVLDALEPRKQSGTETGE